MIPKLTLHASITVEALRANRSLRVEIIGEISPDLSGDVSDLWGDVTRLRGNVTDLSGDVDECEISDEEREAEIDIATLVAGDVP